MVPFPKPGDYAWVAYNIEIDGELLFESAFRVANATDDLAAPDITKLYYDYLSDVAYARVTDVITWIPDLPPGWNVIMFVEGDRVHMEVWHPEAWREVVQAIRNDLSGSSQT